MAWGEVPCTYRGSTDSALISLGISKFRNLLEAYKLNTCFKGVITVITISLQSVNLLLLNAVFLPSDAQATFLFLLCVFVLLPFEGGNYSRVAFACSFQLYDYYSSGMSN